MADETIPSGLKSVYSDLYINPLDDGIWLNKGSLYGWNRLARYSDLSTSSLNQVMTGVGNNTTTKALQVTGNDQLDGSKDGLIFSGNIGNSGLSTIGNNKGSNFISGLSFNNGEIGLVGKLGSNLLTLTNTDVSAGGEIGRFFGRVRGVNAVNTDELPTLSQVSGLISTATSGLQSTSQKGQNNGYASLDGTGKVPSSQMPPIAITDTFVVNSQAAMLALTAEVGDVAVRTDISTSFILRVEPATTLGNWQQLLAPTGAVTSVAGKTGAVTLVPTDITGLDTALNLKANLASPTFTGVPLAPTASGGTNTTQIATTAFVMNAIPAQYITSLTTTGTSGAATVVSGVLNIPNYAGGVSDGDKGDITVSESGATWTIDNLAVTTAKLVDNAVTTIKITNSNVTLAKLANLTAKTYIGRTTNSTGVPEAVTASQLKSDIEADLYDSLSLGITANRTVAVSDRNTAMEFTGNMALTVPTNASVAFPIRGRIDGLIRLGVTLTVTATSGVDIYYSGGSFTNGSVTVSGFKAISLLKTNTNTWYLIGA